MSESFVCPKCAAEILPDESGRLPAQCASCGELLIVDDEEAAEVADETRRDAAEVDEVEEAKIRRIVRDRRAQVRTRSYYLVVMLACVVLAVQLVVRLVPAIRAGSTREAIGWLAGAILLLVVAWSMVARVRQLTQEIDTSALTGNTTPPDFRGLSDGSQHQRNLEELDGRSGRE